MSIAVGVAVKCDRCGYEIFAECENASDDKNPDAEAMVKYATKNMHDWLFTNGAKYAVRKYSFCPKCKEKYLQLISEFLGKDVERDD